jgi:DNA-binding CsgD family transcriptional regulator
VCRALAISDALDLRTLASEPLAATLDALTVGVFLLDRQGRVVHMNRAAERQLNRRNALRIVNHRLAPVDPGAQEQMARALASATDAGVVETAGGHAIALPDRGESGYVANILPVDRGERRARLAPFAAATAVFVQDPAIVPPPPGEAFARLYGLTTGELRFLLALSPGLTVKEAADVLGLSETTAKTHLQRIFAKTGTAKQTELLHLLMSATPPVRAS